VEPIYIYIYIYLVNKLHWSCFFSILEIDGKLIFFDIFMDHKHPMFFGVQLYIAILKGVSRHLDLPRSCLRSSDKTFCLYRCWWANDIVYIIVVSSYIAEMY